MSPTPARSHHMSFSFISIVRTALIPYIWRQETIPILCSKLEFSSHNNHLLLEDSILYHDQLCRTARSITFPCFVFSIGDHFELISTPLYLQTTKFLQKKGSFRISDNLHRRQRVQADQPVNDPVILPERDTNPEWEALLDRLDVATEEALGICTGKLTTWSHIRGHLSSQVADYCSKGVLNGGLNNTNLTNTPCVHSRLTHSNCLLGSMVTVPLAPSLLPAIPSWSRVHRAKDWRNDRGNAFGVVSK